MLKLLKGKKNTKSNIGFSENTHRIISDVSHSKSYIEKLCYGDLDRELKITVLDHDNNGKHDVIGEYLTTVAALQDLVSYKGNADREKAVKIGDEITNKTYGFLCILAANIE